MNITFKELRKIKHSLPTGSIKRIANALQIEEQTVRNYFGAQKYANGQITGKHVQPGPDGGIVNLKDTRILEAARQIITQANQDALLGAS
ncbi:MAG: DNA-binding protein [Bacteroidota bacterium]